MFIRWIIVITFILLFISFQLYLHSSSRYDNIKRNNLAENDSMHSLEYYDKLYEKSFPYTKHTLKDPKLHHIANEKLIVNLYTKYASSKSIQNVTCISMK